MNTSGRTEENKKPLVKRERREEEWIPTTRLGKAVKQGAIICLDRILSGTTPICEPQIVDHLCGPSLREEVLVLKSVQKQTRAGQRTRMKAVAVVGDGNGHVGIGWKSSKEPQVAIRKAKEMARRNIIPVRMGLWQESKGEHHTVACKSRGKCGSVNVSLISAPRGTGIVANPICKKICELAGIKDLFTKSSGATSTSENTVKAVFSALQSQWNIIMPGQFDGHEKIIDPLAEVSDVVKAMERAGL